MTTLMLSAGRATRLGGGCKALTMVGRRTMLDWWLDLTEVTVVCRSEHANQLPAKTIIFDGGGGPATALAAALDRLPPGTEPITVIFADTWAPRLPTEAEFCGVAAASGGRAWDVVEDGIVAHRYVDPDEAALVCVGLYRFAHAAALAKAVAKALADGRGLGEVGMYDVVNHYGLPFLPVVGWQDVGDLEAQARWRLL